MKNKTEKPGKQRKRLLQAPSHRRGKILSAHLASALRSSYNTRSIPVRTGDSVKILRGDHKGFEGKITKVDRKKYKIFVEGITRQKADGTQVPVPIHPSKVEVVRLNLDDKLRKEILKRKGIVEEVRMPEQETLEKTESHVQEERVEKSSIETGGT